MGRGDTVLLHTNKKKVQKIISHDMHNTKGNGVPGPSPFQVHVCTSIRVHIRSLSTDLDPVHFLLVREYVCSRRLASYTRLLVILTSMQPLQGRF